ncbi:hypothetical protein Q8A67_020214 [Cirrhinus molitorella]|uniref:Uncharacterized protein n=1 Tax=Cirrhinus molitorella TaxID=172907 RepID=A0AA88PBE9_9TELE|nr:hypothetical protein Q8A67_020214 [Cirrhinus molitorella]
MMTMMMMMKGSTCKSSRPLPPGRQQEFCKLDLQMSPPRPTHTRDESGSSTGATAPVVFRSWRKIDTHAQRPYGRMRTGNVFVTKAKNSSLPLMLGLILMAQHIQSGYGFQAAGAWRGGMSIFNPDQTCSTRDVKPAHWYCMGLLIKDNSGPVCIGHMERLSVSQTGTLD